MSRPVAVAVSGVLVSGLLGTAVPAATAADATVPGVEAAGPIPTVAGGTGPVWPVLPVGLAQMPRGSVVNPESPYLSVPALRSTGELPVRVVDVTGSGTVWSGTLVGGWTRIGATLTRSREYRVQAQGAGSAWTTVGSFSTTARGAGTGPAVDSGGLSVSMVSGQVGTSWSSHALPGPDAGAALRLTWRSNAAPGVPGLPAGWQLAASPVTWPQLVEAGQDVAAATTPGQVAAVRSTGSARASVSAVYPAAQGRWVSRFVVQRRVGSSAAAWATVNPVSLTRTSTGVRAVVGVPSSGRVWLRLGAVVRGTTLWGPASPVGSTAGLVSGPAMAPRPVGGVGSRSLLTPGAQPAWVRLVGWDGSQLTFIRSAVGVYEQAGGSIAGFANRLTWVGDGQWELATDDGSVTRFSNGRAIAFSAKGALLARLGWLADGRLGSLTNEVGRTMTLRYADGADCPSESWDRFATPPSGLLCQVAYPDGTATDIGYVTAGISAQVALIKDPGNAGVAYGWDERGRLVASRSALVNLAAAAAGPDSPAAGVMTRIVYGPDARVARIVGAAGSPTGPTRTTTIDYPAINDAVLRAFDERPGEETAARARVHVDAGSSYGDPGGTTWVDPITWNGLRQTDAAGLTDRLSVTTAGALRSTTDAQGRTTTFTLDELGQVVRSVGPTSDGPGREASSVYDTVRTAGADVPMTGLRALEYSQPRFTGVAQAEFWRSDFSRGGLSAAWSGRPGEFSAQAAGVWNPASGADDSEGAKRGWQFSVRAAGGTDVDLIVGGMACEEGASPCVLTGLPTGPKAVSVQVRKAGASGWFQVLAAPVGQPLAPVPSADVRPGYGLRSVSGSNDVIPGSPSGVRTYVAYGDPASGVASTITRPGGLVTTLRHEDDMNGRGEWGRTTGRTTPGGRTSSTVYWPDSAQVPLPDLCGGETVDQSGQAREVTRTDGSRLRTWFDLSGRQRAAVVVGAAGATETTCYRYFDDGAARVTETFDSSGALLERVTVEREAGGDPLVTRTTVEHGPAAPVSPGTSASATVRVDLLGREVETTGHGGEVTTTVYDALGHVTSITVTPPAGSGASPLTSSYSYRPTDGRMSSVRVNGVLAATLWYEGATGRLSRIDYPDATSSSYGWLPDGTLGSVAVRTGIPELGTVLERITKSAAGRIERTSVSTRLPSGEAGGYAESRGYSYDSAGRLSRAVITATGADGEADPSRSGSFGYSYGSQDPSCPVGYPSAGKDALRTGGMVNGTSYVVCHDAAGRLASTTSPLVTSGDHAEAEFDDLGRMVSLEGDRPLAVTWGAGGQVARIVESGAGGTITTTLDSYGGTLRDKQVASTAGTATIRYAGAFRVNVDGLGGAVTGTESVQYGLPGGATVTTAPGRTATMTVPGPGGAALVSIPVPSLGSGTGPAPGPAPGVGERFGPYGEPLASLATDSAAATPQYAWRAGSRNETLAGTSSITLLPLRAYHPLLGLFLSPDPVLDAGDNLYSYTSGDPINASDPTGGEESGAAESVMVGIGTFVLGAVMGGIAKVIGGSSRSLFIASTVVTSLVSGGLGYLAAKSQSADDGTAIGLSLAAVATATAGAMAGSALVSGGKKLMTAMRSRPGAAAAPRGAPPVVRLPDGTRTELVSMSYGDYLSRIPGEVTIHDRSALAAVSRTAGVDHAKVLEREGLHALLVQELEADMAHVSHNRMSDEIGGRIGYQSFHMDYYDNHMIPYRN